MINEKNFVIFANKFILKIEKTNCKNILLLAQLHFLRKNYKNVIKMNIRKGIICSKYTIAVARIQNEMLDFQQLFKQLNL